MGEVHRVTEVSLIWDLTSRAPLPVALASAQVAEVAAVRAKPLLLAREDARPAVRRFCHPARRMRLVFGASVLQDLVVLLDDA